MVLGEEGHFPVSIYTSEGNLQQSYDASMPILQLRKLRIREVM